MFADIRHIMGNARHMGPLGVLLVVAIFASEGLVLLLPWLTSRNVLVLETGGSYDDLLFWAGALAFTSVVFVIFDWIRTKSWDYLWTKIYIIKVAEYKTRILSINYATLLKYGTGKLISRMTKGIDAEVDLLHHMVDSIFIGVVRLVIITIIIFTYSVWLGTVFLAFLGVTATIQYVFFQGSRKLADQSEEINEQDKRNLARVIMENFLIRVSNRKGYELEQSASNNAPRPRIEFQYAAITWSIFDFMHIGFRLIEAGIFAYFGYYVLTGEMTIATITLLAVYMWFSWHPIEKILHSARHMGRQYEAYHRMHEFLDEPDVYRDGDREYRFQGGDIQFENVKFGYTDTVTIFEDFSLRFESGKTTALVGHSGSGKSTVLRLLLRIYDPQSGKITADGQELTGLQLSSFYAHIGYLSQDPAIFDGTIRENLEYASPDKAFDDEALWKALEDARLAERVRQFDTLLETEIGERGIKLSGGEKQRLAIARIFLKDPNIVLLDEPTSALDSISEKIISDLLVKLTANKTVVIIAHRLQTVMHADIIHVMEKGRVIESGTHVELLARGGVYSTLVDLQTGMLRE